MLQALDRVVTVLQANGQQRRQGWTPEDKNHPPRRTQRRDQQAQNPSTQDSEPLANPTPPIDYAFRTDRSDEEKLRLKDMVSTGPRVVSMESIISRRVCLLFDADTHLVWEYNARERSLYRLFRLVTARKVDPPPEYLYEDLIDFATNILPHLTINYDIHVPVNDNDTTQVGICLQQVRSDDLHLDTPPANRTYFITGTLLMPPLTDPPKSIRTTPRRCAICSRA